MCVGGHRGDGVPFTSDGNNANNTYSPLLVVRCARAFVCQNALGQSQTFLLDLLSPAGREHVAGIFRQGRALLGAGVLPLKNPVKDYPGYTGAQKALFGSVQLIVLRGLFLSTATMVRVFGSDPNEALPASIMYMTNPKEIACRRPCCSRAVW